MAEMTLTRLLELMPHRRPFLFVDEFIEVGPDRARGRYTFRPDEFFYSGHFPGNPVTPGVILLETMCQTALLPLGMYLMSAETDTAVATARLTVLTDGEAEFYKPVRPGDTVFGSAEKIFWSRRKLKARLELRSTDGELLAAGTASGIGVVLPRSNDWTVGGSAGESRA